MSCVKAVNAFWQYVLIFPAILNDVLLHVCILSNLQGYVIWRSSGLRSFEDYTSFLKFFLSHHKKYV